MQKLSFFLGIDISKDWFDAAIIAAQKPKQVIDRKRFDNDTKGFKAFLKWLKKHANEQVGKLLICMEHTGVYTVSLCCFLEEQQITYTLVPGLAIKRSLGITRGKEDKIDAVRIAQYIRKNHNEIKFYTLPDTAIRQLKALIAMRKRLTKFKCALEVSAKELKMFEQEEVFDTIEERNQRLLKDIKAEIKQINQQMLDIIKEHPALQLKL